jgi:hypothetical protein
LDKAQDHVIILLPQTIHQEVVVEEEMFLQTKQIEQESKDRNKSQ